MPIGHSRLPPFACLLAFEALERRGSFTAAARELQVSQAAVSQKVRELERWVGTELVARERPRLRITGDGRAVAQGVRAGCAAMAEPLAAARRARRHPGQVTLATTNAFALYWLSPRLAGFYARHPDIALNLTTSDEEIAADRREFDLGVVFSAAPLAELTSRVLFDEEVVAVASPEYAKARPPGCEPGEWAGETMLYCDLLEAGWMDWQAWFEANDLRPPAGRRLERFSRYVPMLQGVIAGRGLGMGWRRLVDPLLERGELVRIGTRRARPAVRYRLVSGSRRAAGAGTAAVERWLLEEAASLASFAPDPGS